MLALTAYTQAAGAPPLPADSCATIVPLVMDCFDDPHPLLRAAACRTMPKLVGRRLPGVKDPWSRVLTCTANATRDTSVIIIWAHSMRP